MTPVLFRKTLGCIRDEWKDKHDQLTQRETEEWKRVVNNIKASNQTIKGSNDEGKTPEGRTKTPENLPCILSWLRHLFLLLSFLSISIWLSQTRTKQGKIIKKLDFQPYRYVEAYVTVWFLLGLSAATATSLFDLHTVIFVALFSYRLFDIFQSWVNQFILNSQWNAIHVNRSLVLAFEGYFEIAVIGAIVRFTYGWYDGHTFWDALDDSVNAMLANPGRPASPIQYVQLMFAVLFAAVVVQHVVGRLANWKSGDK